MGLWLTVISHGNLVELDSNGGDDGGFRQPTALGNAGRIVVVIVNVVDVDAKARSASTIAIDFLSENKG